MDVAIKTKNFEEKFGSDVCKDETKLLLLLNHFNSTLMFALKIFELAIKIMKCLKNSNLEKKNILKKQLKVYLRGGF